MTPPHDALPSLAGQKAPGVVPLAGALDKTGAAALEALSRQPLDQIGREGRLVLDMSGVSYMDSAGLQALLDCYRAAREQSITIALNGCRPDIEALLRLAQFDLLCPIMTSPFGERKV